MALITLTSGNDNAPPPSIAAGDTVLGLAGNDTITAPSNSLVNGNQGNDFLVGGGTGVSLYGGQNNDTLRSVSSSILAGDKGDDSLFSVFSDTMYGNSGKDTLIVAPKSAAFGGQDDDVLEAVSSGATGATLAGDKGNDIVKGAATGGALLYGDDVTFTVTGGNDSIWAYGNDTAFGGDGGDSLVSFGGKLLYGNKGDDNLLIATTLTSGTGITLYGGQGKDTMTGNNGGALLYGDKDSDVLIGTATTTAVDTLVGGDGADSLLATTIAGATAPAYFIIAGSDSLGEDTTTGIDTINANAGNDTIITGGGGSVVSASKGNDSIIGGAGNDSFLGGSGTDIMTGGDGSDSLQGWRDNDTLTGGAGADYFIYAAGAFTSTVFNTVVNDAIIAPVAVTSVASATSIGLDSITDFQPGVDKIVLDGAVTTVPGFTDPVGLFTALSATQPVGVAIINVTATAATSIRAIADNSSGLLVYNKADGSLWYNSDATVSAVAPAVPACVQFLWLQPGLSNLASNDFLIV